MAIDKLYVHKPCTGKVKCPFRKDCAKGWLGKHRILGILDSKSFVCHKNNSKQCAGYMLLADKDSEFVQLADRLKIPLDLKGRDQVFDTVEDCLKHHEF